MKDNITYQLFQAMDEARQRGDNVAVHVMRRAIETRPNNEREEAIDARLRESDERIAKLIKQDGDYLNEPSCVLLTVRDRT